MSKMVHIEKGNHVYLFSCESRSTRSGFAHDCTLFRDYSEIASATCHYLNRTWECWNYQMACIEAINKEIAYREQRMKNDYLYSKGITRMSKKRVPELESLIAANEYIQELKQVKEELRRGQY